VKISTNEERTKEYLKKFNREKVLRFLLKKDMPVIFDIGSNDGQSLKEFKSIWPKSYVHCFEPQLECIKSLESIVESYDKNTVFINKYAAGNKNAENIPFFSHDLTSGQSGFNRINLNISLYGYIILCLVITMEINLVFRILLIQLKI
jgi:hypothetical protein